MFIAIKKTLEDTILKVDKDCRRSFLSKIKVKPSAWGQGSHTCLYKAFLARGEARHPAGLGSSIRFLRKRYNHYLENQLLPLGAEK